MKFELFNDHFENAKRYNIPRAAIEMNRSAYGFEIKKDFYKRAKEQMLSSYQPSLF